jgi:hypothetical protein
MKKGFIPLVLNSQSSNRKSVVNSSLLPHTLGRSGNPGGFPAVAIFPDNPMQIERANMNPKTATAYLDIVVDNIRSSSLVF